MLGRKADLFQSQPGDETGYRSKALKEFATDIPADANPKIVYAMLARQLHDEKRLAVVALHAFMNINAYAAHIAEMAKSDPGLKKILNQCLADLNDVLVSTSFMSMQEAILFLEEIAQKYAELENQDQIKQAQQQYEDLISDDEEILSEIAKAILDANMLDGFDVGSSAIILFMFALLARCGVDLTLKKFLHSLPEPLGFPTREYVLEALGPLLLCEALVAGKRDVCNLLLDLGLSVNARHVLQNKEGYHEYLIGLTPLSFALMGMLPRLVSLSKKAMQSVESGREERQIFKRMSLQASQDQILQELQATRKIIARLMALGADPDKPASYQNRWNPKIKREEPGKSPRLIAKGLLKEINEFDDLSDDIKKSVRAALSLVMDAPKLEQSHTPTLK